MLAGLRRSRWWLGDGGRSSLASLVSCGAVPGRACLICPGVGVRFPARPCSYHVSVWRRARVPSSAGLVRGYAPGCLSLSSVLSSSRAAVAVSFSSSSVCRLIHRCSLSSSDAAIVRRAVLLSSAFVSFSCELGKTAQDVIFFCSSFSDVPGLLVPPSRLLRLVGASRVFLSGIVGCSWRCVVPGLAVLLGLSRRTWAEPLAFVSWRGVVLGLILRLCRSRARLVPRLVYRLVYHVLRGRVAWRACSSHRGHPSRGAWLSVLAHLVVSFSSVSWGGASCPSRWRFVACCRR